MPEDFKKLTTEEKTSVLKGFKAEVDQGFLDPSLYSIQTVLTFR